MKKFSNAILLITTGAVLGLALLLAPRLAGGEAPVDERAVSAANRLFEAGRYIESARVLEQVLAQGAENSAVLFNLGNAYYAQGELERALESYERAARLAPRDKDIRHNLELTLSQVPSPGGEGGPELLTSLARLTGAWITINETSLLLLGVWFGACFLLLASRQIERSRTRSALQVAAGVGILLMLLAGASLSSRIYLDRVPIEKVDMPSVVAQVGQP